MKANLKKLKLEIFGESHSDEIGMELGGLKAGEILSLSAVQSFVDRRKSGQNAWSTPRKENDKVIFISGFKDDDGAVTDGGTIRAVIKNTDIKSDDYESIKNLLRPSHADYAAYLKGGISSGGGKFSGRMTAPLCIAGGIAKEILKKRGIMLGAYVSQIGNAKGKSYNDIEVTPQMLLDAQSRNLPTLDKSCEAAMIKEIEEAKKCGDSVGGEIECVVFSPPKGLGDAMFDGLESAISYLVFAVPAVKAIAFGAGFDFVSMRGSIANDAFRIDNGNIMTETNNNGGINGGVSNGMPLTLKVAVKPTPSISVEQKTVDIANKRNTTIKISGRHDTCIVPRAAVCVEAAVSLALLDEMLAFEHN